MGAWGFGIDDNDDAQDAICFLEEELEEGVSLEEALEKVLNEECFDDDYVFGLAHFELENGTIHQTLKKLALSLVNQNIDVEKYENYTDPEKRLRELKSFTKKVKETPEWGEPLKLTNPYLEEALALYVNDDEKTETLDLDELKESLYFARMYKDTTEKIWNIDFVDEREDFYGCIVVPYGKKRQQELIAFFHIEGGDRIDDFYIESAPEWFQSLFKLVKKKYSQFS